MFPLASWYIVRGEALGNARDLSESGYGHRVRCGRRAALGWCFFIWSFDWGHSNRGQGLWLMAMLFPAGFVFAGVLIAVSYPLMLLWELIFREGFPTP
jgi:hypothetical protein